MSLMKKTAKKSSSKKAIKVNRETWLQGGVKLLAAHMAASGHKFRTDSIHVSVGFPKGHGGRQRAIGQCWHGKASEDGRAHLFVCPTQGDPVRVLDILLHEMIHAIMPEGTGHKAAFAKVAAECGLKGPWTATTATPELAETLKAMATKLGEYPHATLTIPERGKKGSPLRLWSASASARSRSGSPSPSSMRPAMSAAPTSSRRARGENMKKCLSCGSYEGAEEIEDGVYCAECAHAIKMHNAVPAMAFAHICRCKVR